MATKYILVGGYLRKAGDGGKAFCEEVVKDFEDPVRILDCLFARPKEVWSKVFAEDTEFFKTHLPDRNLELYLADPGRFTDQVKEASAIYLRGGETEKLIALLQKSGDWMKSLDKKTLAGSSAGAEAIATYYYGLDALTIGEGLGLLPIKLVVHYRSDYNAPNIDWDRAYAELKNYKEALPMLTLAEGEFQVRRN
ncbi:MAG: Type 1 glutamine amidotransferase-like domain-containing protein [Parcubacteria group bacterium]|nr:Type 1 glutamine amidotransferase-like domain-containing protein [Parcubacteria group bacterium]